MVFRLEQASILNLNIFTL